MIIIHTSLRTGVQAFTGLDSFVLFKNVLNGKS